MPNKFLYDNLTIMKADIHPKFYPKAKAKCACGTVYEVGSTLPEISVEICSNCHPFYSGTEKIIDTAGRVERFKRLRDIAAKTPKKSKVKKVTKTAKKPR